MNKYTRNTKWAPAGNFKTLINSLFGETLSAPEIHQFFRTLGVKPQKGEYFGTPNVTLYNMNDVYTALKREKLRQSMRNENKDIKRKVIRLTESDLHRMVQESVKKVLTELPKKCSNQNHI